MAAGGLPPAGGALYPRRLGPAPAPRPQRARTLKSPHPDGGGSHLHPAGRSTMTTGRLGPLVAPLFLGLLLLGFHLGADAWLRARRDSKKPGPKPPGADSEKTGVCPFLKKHRNCTLECISDDDCKDNLKCCRAGCSKICHMPNEKAGKCPKVDLPLTPLGVCQDQCRMDSQCPLQMKCCLNGCGKVSCVTPVS